MPTEPVAPRMQRRWRGRKVIAMRMLMSDSGRQRQRDAGNTGQQRVDAVEHAAVAGQEARCCPWPRRLRLTSDSTRSPTTLMRDEEHDHRDEHRCPNACRHAARTRARRIFDAGAKAASSTEPDDAASDDRASHAAPDALPALAGADARRQLARCPKRATAEVREDVGEPDERADRSTG